MMTLVSCSLLKRPFAFKWEETKIKYLGIEPSRDPETLYEQNFPPLHKGAHRGPQNMAQWFYLPG